MDIWASPADVCPSEKLVDLSLSLSEAVEVDKKECDLWAHDDGGGYRVPPLIFSRLARGGKSTWAAKLFDLLKGLGYTPIIISFNGGFMRREGEAPKAALLRMVALEFLDRGAVSNPAAVECDEAALLQHIDSTAEASASKGTVLIVDELNKLQDGPLDVDTSNLLKKEFLDKKGRYLVFTSHVPINVEDKLSLAMTSERGSLRNCEIAHVPTSMDLSLLRAMDPCCAALTRAEAALYGGIPSLIFTVKKFGAGVVTSRYNLECISIDQADAANVLRDFVRAVRSGRPEAYRKTKAKRFCMLASLSEGSVLRWPLCFISCVLDDRQFADVVAIKGLRFKRLVDSHSVLAQTEGSGKDWELLVEAGVLLRCLGAVLDESGTDMGPFTIGKGGWPLGRPRAVARVSLLPDVMTLDSARDFIASHIDESLDAEQARLVVFTPSFASFPSYDGFVVYTSGTTPSGGGGSGSSSRVVLAYQAKQGSEGMARSCNVLPEWIDAAYLVRGKPTSDETTRIKGNNKTFYLGYYDVLELLGCSLENLMPGWRPPTPPPLP